MTAAQILAQGIPLTGGARNVMVCCALVSPLPSRRLRSGRNRSRGAPRARTETVPVPWCPSGVSRSSPFMDRAPPAESLDREARRAPRGTSGRPARVTDRRFGTTVADGVYRNLTKGPRISQKDRMNRSEASPPSRLSADRGRESPLPDRVRVPRRAASCTV